MLLLITLVFTDNSYVWMYLLITDTSYVWKYLLITDTSMYGCIYWLMITLMYRCIYWLLITLMYGCMYWLLITILFIWIIVITFGCIYSKQNIINGLFSFFLYHIFRLDLRSSTNNTILFYILNLNLFLQLYFWIVFK